jgi:hypothetical protein
MEGFTLVLLIGWLLLLASFAGIYWLDRATKAAETRRAALSGQSPEKGR